MQVDQRRRSSRSAPTPRQTPNTGRHARHRLRNGGCGERTALQYADPNTWVGADTNTNFDADDELVFMAADAGSIVSGDVPAEPPGVLAGTGVAVKVEDPQEPGSVGCTCTCSCGGDPRSDPAGQDYVDYDFQLTSGDYKTTYKRADGPNPETSTITTDRYTIGFTDRWFETSWNVDGGADLLDGHKNVFALGCGAATPRSTTQRGPSSPTSTARCGRSAPTWAPTAARRPSGPTSSTGTTRRRSPTCGCTRSRRSPTTSTTAPARWSMTYRSSDHSAGGVPVDGAADVPAPDPIATWEAVHGAQGTVVTTSRFDVSSTPAPTISWFYRDQTVHAEDQCWGDSSYYGASGSRITSAIANTDPATAPTPPPPRKNRPTSSSATTSGPTVTDGRARWQTTSTDFITITPPGAEESCRCLVLPSNT